MLKRFGVDMVQGYHLDMPRQDHPALGEESPE
jgi:EAL domain-containing protein (putative c-di-GMP-specific phosphodiesterase class I)